MKSNRLGSNQKGVALIIFVFIITLAITVYMLKVHSPAKLRVEQNKKTQQVLSEAKQALLAYSAEEITVTTRVPPLLRCDDKDGNGVITAGDSPYEPKNCNCGLNCMRPGDLPCPDMNNDGEAETACNTQSARLGRLPWKTLGIGDVRDGAGERLWYAVSTRYKNNPRELPLNSETLGTISLRSSTGAPINIASTVSGLVAIVISPGQALTRDNGLVQDRSDGNQNTPAHYLDIALGEDNADFIDTTANGFIAGPVKVLQGGQLITVSNDVVLPITGGEVNTLMETRVLIEAVQAVNYFYSVNGANPDPANLADVTCSDNPIVNDNSNASCATDSSVMFGRLPVGASAVAPSSDIWTYIDVNSILRGESNHNWFQQNGWRSLVQLQKNMPCTANEVRCRQVDTQTTVRIVN